MKQEKFFNQIYEYISKLSEIINLIIENSKELNQSQIDIPNIGITINNKVVELLNIFKKADTDMFENNFSIVGEAIIDDLLSKLELGQNQLAQYSKIIYNIGEKKSKKTINPIKKTFIPANLALSLTEEEQTVLNDSLQKYKDTDNELWHYNLEENIINSIVNYITIYYMYPQTVVPSLLKESILPDMKKLNLGHLIPELEKALNEQYKTDRFKEDITSTNKNNRYEELKQYIEENYIDESQKNKAK